MNLKIFLEDKKFYELMHLYLDALGESSTAALLEMGGVSTENLSKYQHKEKELKEELLDEINKYVNDDEKAWEIFCDLTD